MLRIFKIFLVGIFLVILTACGGGGSPESNLADTTKNSEGVSKDKIGKLNKVKGVHYKTSSGLEGTTDSEGRYKYRPGDNVTFSIEEAQLGTVKAKEQIDVFDFKNALLVSQILHSLDKDIDPTNGFNLSRMKKIILLQSYTLNKTIF